MKKFDSLALTMLMCCLMCFAGSVFSYYMGNYKIAVCIGALAAFDGLMCYIRLTDPLRDDE